MDMPTKKQVLEEMRTIFAENNIQLHVVNSENDVPQMALLCGGVSHFNHSHSIVAGGLLVTS